jgi:MarR family 2-MHQ and catechol resistance regulon transcriptional repressor
MGQLIMRSRRLVWATVSRKLEDAGESIFTWNVLACIIRNGPRTQRELAETIAQHPAGVCRLVEELESQGLVKRERDADDRRKVNVQVTTAGRRWFEAFLPGVLESVEQALKPLSEPERKKLRDLLKKLVSAAPCA